MAILETIGKYLKAADLNPDMDTVVTIERIAKEEMKDKDGNAETNWVAYFEDLEQGLILKATNINLIKQALGVKDTDDMIGKKISLYVKDDIQFGSKIVSGIRVRPKAVK